MQFSTTDEFVNIKMEEGINNNNYYYYYSFIA